MQAELNHNQRPDKYEDNAGGPGGEHHVSQQLVIDILPLTAPVKCLEAEAACHNSEFSDELPFSSVNLEACFVSITLTKPCI